MQNDSILPSSPKPIPVEAKTASFFPQTGSDCRTQLTWVADQLPQGDSDFTKKRYTDWLTAEIVSKIYPQLYFSHLLYSVFSEFICQIQAKPQPFSELRTYAKLILIPGFLSCSIK